VKYVLIAAVAAIIARGILGLINPSALYVPDRPTPKRVEPHVQVSAEGPRGIASGYVRDAKTGQPLIGATVVVEGTELRNAAGMKGEYLIPHSPLGTHKLTASYLGYHDLTAIAVLDSAHGAKADFWLAFSLIVPWPLW